MHRSGTSALTRIIGLLGAELPKTPLGAARGNERGHWEPQPLMLYHDRLLLRLGSHWADWSPLDMDVLPAEERDTIRREISDLIDAEYGAAPLFVLKEPRLCRFAPFYGDLLRNKGIEPRFLLPFRNPLAVIASLNRRDGTNAGAAGLLWLRHVLDAEAMSRDASRAIVSYESLLKDWRMAVRRISARVGIAWPRKLDEAAEEIDAFFTTELQHFAPSRRELMARKEIGPWVKATFQALVSLERDPDDDGAIATLDKVRSEFDEGCLTFGTVFTDEREAYETKLLDARTRQQKASEEWRLRVEDLEKSRAEIAALRHEAAIQDGRVRGLVAQADGHRQEIANLSAALKQRDAEIARLRERLAIAGPPKLEVVASGAAGEQNEAQG